MKWLREIRHRIAHALHWNFGRVETWWRADGVLMVGFRCECGRLEGVHPACHRLLKGRAS